MRECSEEEASLRLQPAPLIAHIYKSSITPTKTCIILDALRKKESGTWQETLVCFVRSNPLVPSKDRYRRLTGTNYGLLRIACSDCPEVDTC